MSPDTQAPDFRERLAQSWADDMEEMAQKAADAEGQPMSTKRVGDVRAVRLYGLKDKKVDPETMLQAMTTTGMPPEILDPENPQCMLIIKEQPQLAKYYAKPAKTPEAAQTLVEWAQYPFAYGLVMGIDDPNERVRYTDHIHKLWQESQPQDAEPEPMTAPAPAPMMPPAPPDPSMSMQSPPGAAPAPDPRQMMGG